MRLDEKLLNELKRIVAETEAEIDGGACPQFNLERTKRLIKEVDDGREFYRVFSREVTTRLRLSGWRNGVRY